MYEKAGRYLMSYGGFLFVVGLIGYASNPQEARTALISGTVCGGVSAFWGLLVLKKIDWGLWAGVGTTLLLACVFTWRSVVSWMDLAGGDRDKLVPAILISLMLAASLALLPRLVLVGLRRRRL